MIQHAGHDDEYVTGTGLGLSLAYDIITKEHSGTIKVDSKEEKGTSFIILIKA